MSNPRVDFWKAPHSWPRDSRSHVFLARAINLIGTAKFREAWTGSEGTTELYQALPVAPMAAGGSEYFAHNLLMRHRPDFNRMPLNWHRTPFGTIPPTVQFTAEEWAAAHELVAQNHAQHGPALARFSAVVSQIASLAEEGRLHTAWRTKQGGEYREIPQEHWNTERFAQRFDFCQIQPFKPFELGSAGDLYCLIFVTRDSLESVIAGLQSNPRDPADSHDVNVPTPNDLECYDLVPLPGKKQQIVFQALKETWKDGRIPKLLTIAQIQDRIDPIVKRMGDRGGASADSIRRALGLKK